jgi:DNA helicase-4
MKQVRTIDELRRTFLGRLLGKSILSFKKVDDDLCLSSLDRILHKFGSKDSIAFTHRLFSSTLEICIDDCIYTYKYLNKDDALRCQRNLNEFIITYLSNRIKDESTSIQQCLGDKFLRDSVARHLQKHIQKLKIDLVKLKDTDPSVYEEIQKVILNESYSCSEGVKKYISIILDYCNDSSTNESDVVKQIRKEHEDSVLKKHKSFFDNAENNPLTLMQRLSVIRNNDFNLVLAAAGTGKTSVMVAKTLYLMKYLHVKSSELLILAYNRNAAKELHERIVERVKSLGIGSDTPLVSTFHALGRNILLDNKKSVHISKLSEDEKKLRQWVANWEENSLYAHPLDYLAFYNALHAREKNGIEIVDNNSPMRTLNDDLVKSYSEVRIANWLYLHGIPYEYEAPYVSKIRIEEGIDYSPDFKLTDDIYIEFFGTDRNGNTREGIDKEKYNTDMQKKIKLHKEMGTTLIDLYWYEMTEDTLFVKLENRLIELGFKLEKKSESEVKAIIVERINNYQFTTLQKVLLNCLMAVRVENLNKEQICERLKAEGFSFAKNITDYIQKLVTDYETTLRENNEIDFDDMILSATDIVNNGEWQPSYKYILVDEFQDISRARYELLKAIYTHCSNVSCTMVGDDWQAIYRFSGGKLDLTTRFSEYFGSHSLTILDKTFRYPRNIADVAGDFIMQNPEQHKKTIETADNSKDLKIHLFSYTDSTDESNKKQSLYYQVRQKILVLDHNVPEASIAVMARYNQILDEFRCYFDSNNRKENISPKLKIKYWTFHGSKGLEADYSFILGLQSGTVMAFPSDEQNDRVVEALLPTTDKYPYSEERRLFYVALTRARKHAYLFALDKQPSSFVEELLTRKYSIDIRTQCFDGESHTTYKCPSCKNGYFQMLHGKYGYFYVCNSGLCRLRPRICEKCGAPMIDGKTESKCMNSKCLYTIPICERCGRVMVKRFGKYGKFLGCSGFGLENDRCDNTRALQK